MKSNTIYIALFSLLLMLGVGTQTLSAQTVNVCLGEQFCLTAGTHRGDVQWQSSPDMTTWTNIAGATSDTFCLTADSAMYFRAEVVEGTCNPIYSDTQGITVSTVIADAGADTVVCPLSAVILGGNPTASGGTAPYSTVWSPATNLNDPNLANPIAQVMTAMTYIVTVTDSLGCMDMDTVMLDTAGNVATGTDTFSYTGSAQMFIVPPCVDSIDATVLGAQGGANWVSNTNYGGEVSGSIPVSEGDTLWLYVGQQATSNTGGWNGGGNGENAGIGGGGASDIRVGTQSLTDRILVAGGGGGAGFWSNQHVVGGVGGGLTGGDGYRNTTTSPGGDGGTQTGSGNGTCVSLNNPSCTGGFGFGGAPSGCGCEGYGGGGGWYGGAGSGNCRGGGGGSGYADTSIGNVSMQSGTRIGDGLIILSW